MIKISENSIVYIVAPANFATGGPESLHQLHYSLIKLGIKSFMYYVLPTDKPDPVHDRFKKYSPLWTNVINDEEDNLLIVPEIYASLLLKYKRIRRSIYWLSVDNYFLSINRSRSEEFLKNMVKFVLGKEGRYSYFDNRKKFKAVIHLAQSYYALEFLKRKGVSKDLYFIHDYINDDFIKNGQEVDIDKKENLVLYNPAKGLEFTQKLMASTPDITWVPLQNLNRMEVIGLLSKAKIYIDFGNHPGMDRFPREAALMMCCVITGRLGSAKFYQDIPIPEKYKYESIDENIEEIRKTIRCALENYSNAVAEFKDYREDIMNQEQEQTAILKEIFSV